jgi:hypothetical protein
MPPSARILYLHGFASSPQSQKARYFQSRFAELGQTLEIPDLAPDFESLTITGQLAVVERLASGRPVSLIGSSMGGYLAALYAARHPETDRLVLLAPAFGFARRWSESLPPVELADWRRTGAREVYHYGDRRPRALRYALLEDGARYEDYPEATQPTLIFHGLRDTVVPASCSEEFRDSRPNAKLELVDSGHELLDVLDWIWPRLRAFLLEPPRP